MTRVAGAFLTRNPVLWRILAIALVLGVLVFLFVQSAAAAGDGEVEAAPGANRFLQTILQGTIYGLLLALASVGLSLIYGTTGLSNFAHGEAVTFGAAVAFVAVGAGAPLWAAILIAIACGAASGWLQDVVLWKQLRRRGVPTMQQMIVSIGLALILVNMIQIWIGPDRLRLVSSTSVIHRIGPVQLSTADMVSMAICIAALGAVGFFLQRTRLGRATRAVSDNPALASATGISVNRVIRIVWMLAGALAALAGPLLALYNDTLDFMLGANILLLMFAAVTLGGLGHPFGALVGALVIGIVAQVTTVYAPTPDLKYAAVLAILIITLLVRPQGILGRKERVG
ncbi:branched-chain amino acid ABC transporter permease [Demequina sp.]|uniref:branched-chain amino acid ABC transporter permease n=1 Tax=Demequina sp. TaxID=2050685 RepID=UPI003D14FD80